MSNIDFEDHFSEISARYSQYRPQYPPELFAYLASIAPAKRLVWDCGTGNGQAAIGLARHFERVYASDASPEQIAHAYLHSDVDYHVERVEDNTLPDRSCDLVTVATAVHWFDLNLFYQQVRRVLRPGGVLAVWTYSVLSVNDAVDEVIERYDESLAGCWPERIQYIRERYKTLPFPFEEIIPPQMFIRDEWQLDQLTGFIASWSAAQRCFEANQRHPLADFWPDLLKAWGDPANRYPVSFELYMRVGKV